MPTFSRPTGPAAVWEPQQASARLSMTAGANPNGVFTSDLSVSEYALLGEAGFEPLGFVVGSTIYHVGMQPGKWSQNFELEVLTQAMYNARELAMSRMRVRGTAAERGRDRRCQAADPGLRLERGGTRVHGGRHRRPRGQRRGRGAARPGRRPVHLRLCRLRTSTGCSPPARVPVAFVLGTCVYHIAHHSFRQMLQQSGMNTEIGVCSPRASTRLANWR